MTRSQAADSDDDQVALLRRINLHEAGLGNRRKGFRLVPPVILAMEVHHRDAQHLGVAVADRPIVSRSE